MKNNTNISISSGNAILFYAKKLSCEEFNLAGKNVNEIIKNLLLEISELKLKVQELNDKFDTIEFD
tara:strand:- start:395 stop:592 length:198 start_codon:yes stop_codon:yes gene_type:complete